MSVTSEMDLDFLKKRAEQVGCWCRRHRECDPVRGDLYLMERKTQRNPNPVTYVKYATVAEVEEALTVIEQETFRRDFSPRPAGRSGVDATKNARPTK
jgi:hypothetical protein